MLIAALCVLANAVMVKTGFVHLATFFLNKPFFKFISMKLPIIDRSLNSVKSYDTVYKFK